MNIKLKYNTQDRFNFILNQIKPVIESNNINYSIGITQANDVVFINGLPTLQKTDFHTITIENVKTIKIANEIKKVIMAYDKIGIIKRRIRITEETTNYFNRNKKRKELESFNKQLSLVAY
jgi:hypothetical protein